MSFEELVHKEDEMERQLWVTLQIEKEKCLMQNAEIVEMIVKYHSNQKKTDLFIAMNASKNIETISKLF
jgi:hypothetical protein